MRLAEALRELFAEQVLRLKGRHGSLTYRCSTGLDAHFLFLLCLQGAAHGIESRWLCFLLCWGGFVSISEVQRHASGADIEASAGAVFVLNRRLRIRCHVPPICAIGISYAPACCVAKYWRSAKGGGAFPASRATFCLKPLVDRGPEIHCLLGRRLQYP